MGAIVSTLLQERYGRAARPARRLLLLAIVAAGLALALGFIGWVTILKRPDVTWQDLSFNVRSDAETQVTFDVAISSRARSAAPGGRPVVICTVHALNQMQTEVGLQDVRVATGPQGRARATVVLDTSERAVTGLVKACTLA
jgi:Domain of unknown function (DUF4307)